MTKKIKRLEAHHLIFIGALILLYTLILPLISGQPFIQSSPPEQGLDLEYPKFSAIKLNENFELNTHVYNSSNGVDYSQTSSCYVHLYNSTGHHILEKQLSIGDEEQNLLIGGGNFSRVGVYAYILTCNSTSQGGFVSGNFYVTGAGLPPAEDNFLIFIYISALFMFVFLISMSILTLVKLATTTETIFGVLTSASSYLFLIFVWYLGSNFMINGFIVLLTEPLIAPFGFLNVLLPFISLFITMFVKGTQKKKPISIKELTGRSPLNYG